MGLQRRSGRKLQLSKPKTGKQKVQPKVLASDSEGGGVTEQAKTGSETTIIPETSDIDIPYTKYSKVNQPQTSFNIQTSNAPSSEPGALSLNIATDSLEEASSQANILPDTENSLDELANSELEISKFNTKDKHRVVPKRNAGAPINKNLHYSLHHPHPTSDSSEITLSVDLSDSQKSALHIQPNIHGGSQEEAIVGTGGLSVTKKRPHGHNNIAASRSSVPRRNIASSSNRTTPKHRSPNSPKVSVPKTSANKGKSKDSSLHPTKNKPQENTQIKVHPQELGLPPIRTSSKLSLFKKRRL
ncbi:hypothetical protein H4219_004336 [Mycoemilia scoparia]|uniref:Uncharacterized protein n=1 Tax=Mycoemilia scoparia TaxID=417184 RepID=A0A9W7ZWH9_9FUNG|nr:hypothetical protein H4219_004336 [Mycoemilia scoparia]